MERDSTSLWGARTIGWITLLLMVILGVFVLGYGPIFGIASGFVLLSMNQHRMGYKRKAYVHLIGGLLLAVLSSVGHYWIAREYWLSLGLLFYLGYLVVTFIVVAYLHVVANRDIHRFQENHSTGNRSVFAAIGVALVVSVLSFFARLGIVYGMELARVPRLEPTSQFISGSGPMVSGVMHPWGDGEIRVDGRHLVLCDLIETTRFEPYDCIVTGFAAMTDAEGRFQIEDVPEGEYLILYESGVTSFDVVLDEWSGKRIGIGDYWATGGLFQDDLDSTFTIYKPEGGQDSEFYRAHLELTLTGGGSPFFVAHDIEAALSAEYNWREDRLDLPEGIFVPTVLQVVEGYASYVEFDVIQGEFQ